MLRFLISLWIILVATSGPALGTPRAQAIETASRGPRFHPSWDRAEVMDEAVLQRRISLNLRNATVDQALKEITRLARLEISYSAYILPGKRTVSVQATSITVAAALTEILLDTQIDVTVGRNGGIALTKRVTTVKPRHETNDGSVRGRVTDGATGIALAGATITVGHANLRATTASDGTFHIPDVSAGTHVVHARFIGYSPASAVVTVTLEAEAVADFALSRSVQTLNEVAWPRDTLQFQTEAKALPTPVSIIGEEEIELQRPETVQELVRRSVPTIVSWDQSAFPHQTPFSARGGRSLSPGTGRNEGIRGWDRGGLSIDRPSGSQQHRAGRGAARAPAAAIYGSDAIGGVIQIFTKRGPSGAPGPQVSAESAVGLVETPYEGVGGVVRQHYRASLRGQEPTVGYHLGGSYSRTSDYLPDDEISAQSSPGVHGGINYAKGILTLDVSGRYTVHNLSSVFNPALAATGFSLFTKPQFQPSQIRNQTIGGRLEDSSTSVVEARNHSRYRSLLPGHRAVQAPANHTLGYTPLHSELGANQELCRLQHLSNGRPDSRSSRFHHGGFRSLLPRPVTVADARCAEHYRDHSDRPEPSGHLKPQRDDQYWLLHARTTRCRRSPFLHRRSTSRGQETPISAKASAHHYPLAWEYRTWFLPVA